MTSKTTAPLRRSARIAKVQPVAKPEWISQVDDEDEVITLSEVDSDWKEDMLDLDWNDQDEEPLLLKVTRTRRRANNKTATTNKNKDGVKGTSTLPRCHRHSVSPMADEAPSDCPRRCSRISTSVTVTEPWRSQDDRDQGVGRCRSTSATQNGPFWHHGRGTWDDRICQKALAIISDNRRPQVPAATTTSRWRSECEQSLQRV